jgi:anion transporter
MPSFERATHMSSSDARDNPPRPEGAADDSATVAVRPPPARPAPPRPAAPARVLLPLSLTIAAGIAVLLPATLPSAARIALFAVLLAIILWSTTPFNTAYVGLGATMLLLLTGVSPQERLFGSLASDVIWLMIGAFILGGAVEQTGLAMRLAQRVVERARTVRGLFWFLTAVLIPSSLFIPSISGRAVIAIPIFRSISSITGDRRITRALALLFPTVILVSTISSLVGAGSHLVANKLLSQVTGRRLSFGAWVLYGMPFGVLASGAACAVIMALFLDGERRRRCIRVPRRPGGSLSRSEKITLAVGATMVVLWLSERWHGYESATVTLAGALVLTAPGGALSWKEGVKAVDWNLLLFVGAALVLGGALIDTGAAGWLFQALLAQSGIESARGHLLLVVAIGVMSLTSHLYLTSHVARVVALGPLLLHLAADRDLDPASVVFIGTVGIDYCLTFPVSSKALLMFQGLEGETFRPADLMRLSAVMLPIHLALLVVFYLTYWRWMGLAL